MVDKVKVCGTVTVVEGDGKVVVLAVTPMHEQALENCAESEHADANVGIEEGAIVVVDGATARSTRVTDEVTVIVVENVSVYTSVTSMTVVAGIPTVSTIVVNSVVVAVISISVVAVTSSTVVAVTSTVVVASTSIISVVVASIMSVAVSSMVVVAVTSMVVVAVISIVVVAVV